MIGVIGKGLLIGSPLMVSIDTTGEREDKTQCAYIVQGFNLPLGYAAYIFDKSYTKELIDNFLTYAPNITIVYDVESVSQFNDYDIVEISENGVIRTVYSDISNDNVLFITNKCNSNCIMCPDSDLARSRDIGNRYLYLKKLIELIPTDTQHLTITGGEPTLLKWDLIDLLKTCQSKFSNTDFLMLSNGRSFAIKEYREAFLQALPKRFRLAIPLYSYDSKAHDEIVRVAGGYDQTLSALKLLQHRVDIEIRIVIMKNNYSQLPMIASFIARELPKIKTVSFMGLELLGNAAKNKNVLWVDYSEAAPYIEQSLHNLYSAGIDGRIYNFPLCSLPRKLWSVASKSITDYKVRYKPECDMCNVKSICGGFFFSTINYNKVYVKPVRKE